MDSLRGVLVKARNDTTRIGALIAMSEHIYATDPDTNAVICREAIRQADEALGRGGVNGQVRSALLRQKATAINNLAVTHFIYGELDSALACFRRARSIHRANGAIVGEADAWNNEGMVHEARGDHAQQRRCLTEALKVYERAGDQQRMAAALNNIGQYHTARGLMDSALFYMERSLAIYRAIKDERGIAHALLNIGMNHRDRGRPAEALELLLSSETAYARLGEREALATCRNNIATIYADQGLPGQALRYYHQALDLNTAMGDRIGQADNHMNLGSTLEAQGELDMALQEFQKSLDLYLSTGDRRGEALVRGHLGNLWKNKGDRPRALLELRHSLALSKELDSPRELATALYKLGHYFEAEGQTDSALYYYQATLQLDQSIEDREGESFALYSIAKTKLKQGRTKEAITLADQALSIAQQSGYPVNILRATEVLHEGLARQGSWSRALEMLELHQQMKDSLNNAENAKKTVRLQMRYDFDRKQLADSIAHATAMAELESERQIAILEGEQARNRSWAFGIGGVLLLGGGGMIYRIDRKRRRERFERDAALLQMKALRNQMNPHFIFNALNSINHYVQENERDLASGFLTKFARLMRLVLENSRREEVPLTQDLEALRLYMDLEQARMNNKFDYSIHVDPAIDQETAQVPPLVLQPFMENAIWHGISRKEGKGNIALTVRQEAGQLIMTVEDNGVGRRAPDQPPLTDAPPKTSLGTTITKDRLAMLGQQRGMESGFRFVDLVQGTRVEVFMPLVIEA
ncbi:MAG TPA: tetratricopeptide repeat protein [Flavobacteriales bacterium]|nr:tetratricopeptide repeat protein [Flavobacteriales bacterium]HNU55174.1 tetratricopeptide repeat protein [Flavobacteriales bacterium]